MAAPSGPPGAASAGARACEEEEEEGGVPVRPLVCGGHPLSRRVGAESVRTAPAEVVPREAGLRGGS